MIDMNLKCQLIIPTANNPVNCHIHGTQTQSSIGNSIATQYNGYKEIQEAEKIQVVISWLRGPILSAFRTVHT